MKKFLCSTMTLFLLYLVLPAISPAEELKTDETYQGKQAVSKFEDVIIKEKKEGRKIEEQLAAELGGFGHPLEVITSQEIKEKGFVDLSQVLETLVPGLFSTTRAGRGSYNYASIHGSNNILLLMDGVRVNNRLYGNSMENYMNFISVHSIERIEILKSGESLFYGTDATAGVINIVTKEITDEMSGEFGASYGEYDYMETFGHVTGKYKDHGWMVFGSAEGWDGYMTSDDETYNIALNPNEKKETAYDRKTLGMKYEKTFDLAGKSSLKTHLLKQKGHFDYGYPNYQSVFSDWEEEMAILKWDHDVNDNFSYSIKTYVHTWWSEATFVLLDGAYLSDAADWGYDDFGANFMTSTRWGRGHELLFGFDFQNYWGKDEFSFANFSGDHENVYGIFASYRPYLSFSPQTKMALGLRYDKTSGTDATVWDVSLRRPVYGPTYVRGVVNTSFCLPTVRHLYGTNPLTSRHGNPDLDPETSFNVEAGVGGEWRYFKCDFGYFYRGIEDMISTASRAGGGTTYVNTEGTTKIHGVEVSAELGPFDGWSLFASTSWVSADDKDTDEQIELIPEMNCKANLRYRHRAGGFGADLTTRYTGAVYERGLRNFDDVKYGKYFIADASIFLRFGTEKQHKLTLRVENIFDESYETRYYSATNANGDDYLYHFDGLPRNAVIGYTYNF